MSECAAVWCGTVAALISVKGGHELAALAWLAGDRAWAWHRMRQLATTICAAVATHAFRLSHPLHLLQVWTWLPDRRSDVAGILDLVPPSLRSRCGAGAHSFTRLVADLLAGSPCAQPALKCAAQWGPMHGLRLEDGSRSIGVANWPGTSAALAAQQSAHPRTFHLAVCSGPRRTGNPAGH